jgi:hypothetical protein
MNRFFLLFSLVIFSAGFLGFFFPGYSIHGIVGVSLGLLLFIFAKRSSIFLFMANMAFTSGGRTKALTWLGRAYRAGALSVSIRITFGYQLLKENRLEEAEKIFTEVQASLGSKGGKKTSTSPRPTSPSSVGKKVSVSGRPKSSRASWKKATKRPTSTASSVTSS